MGGCVSSAEPPPPVAVIRDAQLLKAALDEDVAAVLAALDVANRNCKDKVRGGQPVLRTPPRRRRALGGFGRSKLRAHGTSRRCAARGGALWPVSVVRCGVAPPLCQTALRAPRYRRDPHLLMRLTILRPVCF